jgi:hypothetical protein
MTVRAVESLDELMGRETWMIWPEVLAAIPQPYRVESLKLPF